MIAQRLTLPQYVGLYLHHQPIEAMTYVRSPTVLDSDHLVGILCLAPDDIDIYVTKHFGV